MIKILSIACVIALTAGGVVFAQEQKTIQGDVVGVACYTEAQDQMREIGDAQSSCSLSALKSGEPAGIVEKKSGKLYIAISSDGTNIADKLLPNVAKTVEVTGQVQEKQGINTIMVQEVKPLDTSSSPAAMNEENKTENATGMGAGMGNDTSAIRQRERLREKDALVPWAAAGATGDNDTLYNVTKDPGIHDASSKELPGIPNRGTRTGEVYLDEGESNDSRQED